MKYIGQILCFDRDRIGAMVCGLHMVRVDHMYMGIELKDVESINEHNYIFFALCF